MSNYLDALSRIQEAEEKERMQDFLAPIAGGHEVALKVCGIIGKYRLTNRKDFQGWAVLRLDRKGTVRIVREATLGEVRCYCENLLTASFILIDEIDGAWYALQQSTGKRGLLVETPVEIKLLQKPVQFGQVIAGFDGKNFWYVGTGKRSQSFAANLRGQLANNIPEDQLSVSGLLQADRMAYKMNYLRKQPKSAYNNSNMSEKDRIELAVGQAGARMDGYWANNQYSASVRFERGGKMHTVVINRGTLEVISSGICLSGRDRDFDLTSVIGVLTTKSNNGDNDWDDE